LKVVITEELLAVVRWLPGPKERINGSYTPEDGLCSNNQELLVNNDGDFLPVRRDKKVLDMTANQRRSMSVDLI
jgi:hypothetical protein